MSMRRLGGVLAAVQVGQFAQNGSSTSSGGPYVIQGYNMSTNGGNRAGRYETDLHGNVNILLGGAMLSGVVIVVVLVCYCCHRNIRKHQPQDYSQYWRAEPDVHSLEVFTMDSHAMCFERSGVGVEDGMLASLSPPIIPGPPPAYESLIFNPENLPSPSEKKLTPTTPIDGLLQLPPNDAETSAAKEEESRRDEGLPSYEAALKLEANGYV